MEPPEERPTVQGAGRAPQRLIVGAGLLQATLSDQTGGVGLGGRVVGRSALGPDALGGLVRTGSEVRDVGEPWLPLARPQEPLGVGAEGVRELLFGFASSGQLGAVRTPRSRLTPRFARVLDWRESDTGYSARPRLGPGRLGVRRWRGCRDRIRLRLRVRVRMRLRRGVRVRVLDHGSFLPSTGGDATRDETRGVAFSAGTVYLPALK